MVEKSWTAQLTAQKKILTAVVVGFFIIELAILIMASVSSGKQSWLKVMDDNGQVIYEVKGSTLTNFNKYYFENTFGSLDRYTVELETREIPFPFRGWLSAAVGIPVGLVLLLAFVVKASMTILHGRQDKDNPEDMAYEEPPSHKAHALWLSLARLDIFIIGFLLVCAVLLFWVVPNLITFLARAGLETFENYKYFFMGLIAALLALFAGFMVMKYRLAQKSMEAQTELKKYEMKLAHERQMHQLLEMPEKQGDIRQIEHVEPPNTRTGSG